jgi:hypothetical protein
VPQKLKNVFDVKQTSTVGTNRNTKKDNKSDSEKPFGSSYYYAHNNPNAKGGYKDGLKMEDYVMNGPRLLSVNGVSVVHKNTDRLHNSVENPKDDNNHTILDHDSVHNNDSVNSYHTSTKNKNDQSSNQDTTQILTSAQAATRHGKNHSIPISRYLWDDDGNTQGIARIYIDSLPASSSSSSSSSFKSSSNHLISWEEASISKNNVSYKLIGSNNDNLQQQGQGLLIQIQRIDSSNITHYYHLYIPKMYGEVENVKTIVKTKKLIVKLQKKGMNKGIFSKAHYERWPQLPSKTIQSHHSTPDSIIGSEIDEDLFRGDSSDS